MTAGLQAMGSRTTPKPFLVPTTKVKKPSRSVSVASSALPKVSPVCSLWLMKAAPTSVSFSVSKVIPRRRSSRRTPLWFESEPLCTRHWSEPVENGCAPIVVTADSVAMRVWPIPWLPPILATSKRAATSLGRPTSLKISIDSPADMTFTFGRRCASAVRAASICASGSSITAWVSLTSMVTG